MRITVGPDTPADPTVSIVATRSIAEESSAPFRRLPLRGEFTISRTGATTAPLSAFVHLSGMATRGSDYENLPLIVTIPAGASATTLDLAAIPDPVVEGIETVVATVSDCPPDGLEMPCFVGFVIDPAQAQATIFVREDGITQASLAITNPKEGANFNVGDPISIEAVAIDLEGYISRIEFWDFDRRIGGSEIVFIRAPDPGTPIAHSFEWRHAAAGAHKLTARVVNANGAVLSSQPVQITVGSGSDRAMVEIEATDASSFEEGTNGAPDAAVFTIRRIAGPPNIDLLVYYSIG